MSFTLIIRIIYLIACSTVSCWAKQPADTYLIVIQQSSQILDTTSADTFYFNSTVIQDPISLILDLQTCLIVYSIAGWHKLGGILKAWLVPEFYPQSAYVEILATFATKMPWIKFLGAKTLFWGISEDWGLRIEDWGLRTAFSPPMAGLIFTLKDHKNPQKSS